MVDLPADDFADSVTDTTSPMGVLGVGQSVTGVLEDNRDNDTFAIDLTAGTSYLFGYNGFNAATAEAPARYVYTTIQLLDSSGAKLQWRSSGWYTQLLVTPTASGRYYLLADNTSNFSTGAYSISADVASGLGSTVSISDTQVVEGNSGTTSADFKVTRSGGTGAFSVKYETASYSAANTDYDVSSGVIEFADGETEKTISIVVNGDTLAESDEYFKVTLQNATLGATIGRSDAFGMIYDDDSPDDFADSIINTARPYGQLAIGTSLQGKIDGNDDTDVFAVDLTAGEAYYFASSTQALGNMSYLRLNMLLRDVNGAIIVPDSAGTAYPFFATPDATGTYYLQVKGGSYFDVGSYSVSAFKATGLGSSVSISDASVVEGDSGTKNAVLTVTRTGGTGAFDVDFNLSSSGVPSFIAVVSASSSPDGVSPTAGTLHFAEGENSKQISLDITGDLLLENDQIVFVVLSNPTRGASITDGWGILTIFDDDQPDDYANQLADPTAPIGQLVVNYPKLGLIEYAYDNDMFAVKLEAGLTYAIGMGGPAANYDTMSYPRFSILDSNGNEIVSSGYVDQWTTAQQFTPDSSGVFYIRANGTNSYDPRFRGRYGVIVEAMTGVGSNVSISDATAIQEGNDGTQTLTYTVTRTGGTGAFSVTYKTLELASPYDGFIHDDATPGSDFVEKSGTIDFAEGETSKKITVTVLGDSLLEYNEEVGIQIVRASGGAEVTDAFGFGFILNDDDQEDFADTIDDTTNPIGALPINGQVNGNFELRDDCDVFTVELLAGQSYVFSAQSLLQYYGLNTSLALLTDHGVNIAEGDNTLSYSATMTGTYYLSATAISRSSGPYQISADHLQAAGSRVSIGAASITEGNTGTKFLNFTVTRTSGSGAFDVAYFSQDTTSAIHAAVYSDYLPVSGTLAFSESEMTKTIAVEIMGDNLPEDDETFLVNLYNATEGAIIENHTGEGKIISDEPIPDDFADSLTDTADPIGVIPIKQEIFGKLERDDDVDVFQARLEAGAVYFFKPFLLPNADFANAPLFEIHGPRGEEVEWIHYTSNTYVIDPFRVPTDGIYNFAIKGQPGRSTGDYHFSVSPYFSSEDDFQFLGPANVAWHGMDGNDEIRGTDQADIIYGDAGMDKLNGSQGADSLFGGSDNDRIIFDMNDIFVDGGTGYDIAEFDMGSFSRPSLAEMRRKSFEILAQSTEEVLFYPAYYFMKNSAGGTYKEELRDMSGASGNMEVRTTLFDQYRREELVEITTGFFDRIVYDYDPSDTAAWSSIVQTFGLGGLRNTEIDFDDGSRIVTDFDQGSANDWQESVSVYATDGALDYTDRRYDDGSRLISDGDQASDRVWSSAATRFSAPDVVDYQDYVYDDGRRILYDNDEASAFSWSQRITVYVADGSYDYQDTRFDDGRRVIHDADNGDASPVWDFWESYFDASGKLTTQRVTWDNGSVRIFNL